MSRAPQLEPAWLVGLLLAWSRRDRFDGSRRLGYPTICVMLRDSIAQPAQSYETTGYTPQEIDRVGEEVAKLRDMRKFAVMRYCRPGMVITIDQHLGREFDTDTWLYHLKGAMKELAELMRPAPKMIERKQHVEIG
jgi:hypothetical protein